MKALAYFFIPIFFASALFPVSSSSADYEWSLLKAIALQERPRDVAVSPDGATAYVLCDTRIEIVSVGGRRIMGFLPVGKGYSRISVTPAGDMLLLTESEKKQISILQVVQVFDISPGNSPLIGNPDAPVMLTAFLDFQCPYCSKAYPLLEQALVKYPRDVKVVIKHYPLKFHAAAEPAAKAALAAARQNKYKELSNLMMQQSGKLSDQAIRMAAQQTGLDMERFDSDVKDVEIRRQIAADMADGSRCNVRGVPSIFINGRPIKSYTVENLSVVIEQELNKKKS